MTSAEYDELGRRVRSVNADLTSRGTVYDLAGNVVAEIDERGNRTEYAYDAQNRRVLTRSAVGDESLVSFDAVGNREMVTDGRGNVTTFEYDLNRRQIATVFADGYRTRTVYDLGGRVVLRLDQRNVATRYEYDGLGRLVAVVDALGGRTSYGYDELGNRVSQTDANVHTTRFGFDSEGRMVSRTLPLGQRESLEYDAEGNQTAKVTFKGDRLEYDFDSNGRMIRKRVPGYSEYVLTYTPTGQRESVLDYRGLTSYEYDLRDRLLRVDNPEGTFVSYTYDLGGNRASVSSPSQTVEYTFDAVNRMETVTSPAGVAKYAYDAASNQVGLTHANGVHEVRAYDALNRLLSIENRTSRGQLVTSHAYTLGPTGARVAVQEHNSRFVTWTYDDLYRLVGEDIVDSVNGDEGIGFVYDPVGNRLSRTDRSAVTGYGYDDNDRLLDVEGVARTYDDNGNTLTAAATTYTWSPENRLIDANTGADVLAFEYNIDGIRVSKDVDGTETEYVLDSNRAYAEVIEERGTAGLEASYVHGQDLMSQERGAARSFYHADGIGSTRNLTDSLQSMSDSYAYEAFGETYGASGTTVNGFRFTGEQLDSETGLVYLRARHYDPETARFLGRDPWLGSASQPSTKHAYAYAQSNPANATDPTGQFTMIETVIALAAQSFLATLPAAQVNKSSHIASESITGGNASLVGIFAWLAKMRIADERATPSHHFVEAFNAQQALWAFALQGTVSDIWNQTYVKISPRPRIEVADAADPECLVGPAYANSDTGVVFVCEEFIALLKGARGVAADQDPIDILVEEFVHLTGVDHQASKYCDPWFSRTSTKRPYGSRLDPFLVPVAIH